MLNMQTVRNEVRDYIRNSGERVKDYDIEACADYLYDVYYCDGVAAFWCEFERAVFNFRIAE